MARLAFFGTPEFSLNSLKVLHDYCVNENHELVCVITQPDKKRGRSQKLLPPPVKAYALELGHKIIQPTTLRKSHEDGQEFFDYFSKQKIDLAIVVAYGKILPQRILDQTKNGFVNIHASLLPRFRGAAPIQRAIMEGDKTTGVCLMDMVLKMDEGDIFQKAQTPILPFDTHETLARRLSLLGANLLKKYLGHLVDGKLSKVPQANRGISHAAMIEKKEGALKFDWEVRVLKNHINGLSPWPSCFGTIDQKRVKLFSPFCIPNLKSKNGANIGEVVAVNPYLGVQAKDGVIFFEKIQFEGKKILPTKIALANGQIKVGDSFSSCV